MNLRTRKLCLPLILIVASAALFAYLPAAYLTESSDADEVLLFLEEVVRIDVSQYDVTLLGTSVTYPDWLNGLPQRYPWRFQPPPSRIGRYFHLLRRYR